MPEALVEGTNGQIVISPLATLVYKHIPIAQRIAENCNFFQKGFLFLKSVISVSNDSVVISLRKILDCLKYIDCNLEPPNNSNDI